jgi:hypothetical protein
MAAHCTKGRKHYQEVGKSDKQNDYLTKITKDKTYILKRCPNMSTVFRYKIQYLFAAYLR